MLPLVGKYKFTIDAYLSDFRGNATLSMIGGYMLQVATKHANERGFGYTAMTEDKRAWVLSRMAIELSEYPKNDTVLEIQTWVASVNKLFTERHFAFIDETGKNIGYAKSIWACIDLSSRRPTNVLDLERLSDYVVKDKECPIEGLKKILPIKDVDSSESFDIKYSDIDINKHLNSMKYIEYFVDLFTLEDFKKAEIKRFEINYISEARYGEKIDLLKKDEQNDIFVLEMKNKGSIVSAARVTWS